LCDAQELGGRFGRGGTLVLPAVVHAAYPEGREGKILFSGTASPANLDIFSINPDGSGRLSLTTDPGLSDDEPAISPDRRAILFVRDDDLWRVNADGSSQARIYDAPAPNFIFDPHWSPDGKQIAVTYYDGVAFDILLMNADGTGAVNLTKTTGIAELNATFSPDGRKLAFRHDPFGIPTESPDIATMNLDGSGIVELTTTGDPIGESSPDYSPDGEQIAYSRCDLTQCDLWVMNADGSSQRQLTTTPLDEGVPSYSPTGERMAFEYDTGSSYYDIGIVNTDGSGYASVTKTPVAGSGDFAPDWENKQRCGGKPATIVGDDGPDKLKGTKRKDVISANGGKDTVRGRGGNDVICLGPGKGKAVGGGGTDRCLGAKGKQKATGCERTKKIP
jgi:Tol biopolymer transport system component